MNHLHEVAGTAGAAVDVAVFGSRTGGAALVEPWGAWNVTAAGSKCFEDRVEALDGLFGPPIIMQ